MRRREMNLNFDAQDVNTDIQLRHTDAVVHRRIQTASQTGWVSKACPAIRRHYAFDATRDLTVPGLAGTAQTTAARKDGCGEKLM
ncbi:hypothetical protein C8R45DRAFT_1100816 [Mycena sanguinolenta]|nr:hypothetical protein C8R45DRAFT_1100816 [Mycena sanguinolenta]